MPNPNELPTLIEEQQRIVRQVEATYDFMGGDPESSARLGPWLRWQCREMLKTVTLRDFTVSELMTLTALIGPIFARRLPDDLGAHVVPDGGLRSGLRLV